jgi:uncharacterized protein
MDTPTPISVDLGRIAQDLQIRRVQVESVVQLLDEGNTVPFITRYRKERTGNLSEVAIREIQLRVGRLRELAERKETILRTIEAQGKLNEELAAAIRAAENPKRLEDLYLPFKPKKKTKASDARDKGLEPLALRIWNRDETLADLRAAAEEFVSAEKGVETLEQALEGVGHILAEAISELASVRDAVRRVVWRTGKIVTSKSEVPEGEGLEYRDYFNYSEPIAHIPPHRVLAINRGDKEGPLKVKLEVSRPDLEGAAFSQLPLEDHPHGAFFRDAAIDALDRLLLPSMEREVRRDLTDLAERHAVDVFARNLRSLLLQPPIHNQIVLAIDPGFRTGCKVAVLDAHGNLLEHSVIHPHAPQNRRSEAKVALKDLVGKHSVSVVAIGNGTACRETEELVAEIIQEGTTFSTDPAAAAAAEAAAIEHARNHAQIRPERPSPTTTARPAADASTEPEALASEGGQAPESASVEGADSHPAPPDEPVQEVAVAEAAHEHNGPTADSACSEASIQENSDSGSTTSLEHQAHDPKDSIEALPPISGGAPEDGEGDGQGEPAVPVAAEPVSVAASEGEPSETPIVETLAQAAEAAPEENHAPIHEAEVPPEPPVPASTEEASAPSTEAVPAPISSTEVAHVSGATPPAGSPAAPTTGGKSQHAPRPPKVKAVPAPPRPHPADALLAQMAYVIVNEAGASVYSASPIGREEFPDFDATLRGTISIGRRLEDPLSELVKIEPQSIGVGLYQHDVNPKQLKESLEAVIASCVNFVGVDLNTASVPLLRHVSGLNQLTARRLVERRTEHGPFSDREQIKEVEGIGPATFTQAAGFLKIPNGANPLDRTWVHPESYAIAVRLLETLGFGAEIIKDKTRLPELHAKLNEADVPALAKDLEVGELTLRDIFEALARPDRDPRDDLPKPIFKKGVLKLEDLQAGMELKGTVLNVVDFGAFVDIGLKDSGLVHISQLANRYIKSPHDVVSVGDVVTVWVMGVDQERKRVSLTMVKPGTERPRGAGGGGGGRRSGGGGGGERDRRAPGQGQGQGRPPRQEGSALTTPPVGATHEAPASGGEVRQADSHAPSRPMDRPSGPGPGPGPGRGPGGMRPGAGGPPGRGPRPAQPGRFERTQAPRPAPRPSKPAPPPPPLSKDALAGSVPLRSFGQLKQLWQARTEDPEPDSDAPPTSAPQPEAPLDSAPEPAGEGSAQEAPSGDA